MLRAQGALGLRTIIPAPVPPEFTAIEVVESCTVCTPNAGPNVSGTGPSTPVAVRLPLTFTALGLVVVAVNDLVSALYRPNTMSPSAAFPALVLSVSG